MKICFPVAEAKGLESQVYGHFGSAPAFVLVDTETGDVRDLVNADAQHEHGQCSPLKALSGEQVDAVVVGGIGRGALGKLNASGVKVFRGPGEPVSKCLELFKSGGLQEFSPMLVCGGHGSGGGCSHH